MIEIETLREKMKEFDWSQRELADELGISVRQLQRILAGQCKLRPPIEKLIRAAIPFKKADSVS